VECWRLLPRSFMDQIMIVIRLAEERGPQILEVTNKIALLNYNVHTEYYHLHVLYSALTTVALPPGP
jgi:hypothetical protein